MKNKNNNEWLCKKIKRIKGTIKCEYTECDEDIWMNILKDFGDAVISKS